MTLPFQKREFKTVAVYYLQRRLQRNIFVFVRCRNLDRLLP